MTEAQLQAQIFQYHWNNLPNERGLLFHVNNKARNTIEGAKFKAIGVIAGVSDLIYLKPGGNLILIELKIEGGVQSKEQKKWGLQVKSAGYQYLICRSLEEFIKLIIK
jgi:hypothetical protein